MITAPDINLPRLRQYRLSRIRQRLAELEIDLAVLQHPVSLRYAVDFREYPLFQAHIPMFYLMLSAQGPVIMHGASHQSCELVDEYRPSAGFNPFDSGFDLGASAESFADQVSDCLDQLGIPVAGARVAIESMPSEVYSALQHRQIGLLNAEPVVEHARTIKSSDEIQCIKHSVAVAEFGMTQMRSALKPGISENQLWSILHQVNIAHDGDWMEGRMLASGPRTNPWLQEAGPRIIQSGELVALDTDMIGPFGYCADISRTWLCGDVAPTVAQRDVYRHAFEEVQHNIERLQPGISVAEFVEDIYPRRAEFIARRYPCVAHGVGMSDEYPKLYYPEDSARQYDATIEAGMVICIESYTGSEQGGEGVKLEQMVHVTDTGNELLSNYPFEEILLA